MEKTDSQLSATLYRRGTTSTSPWNKQYANLQITTGALKFYVEKDGQKVMMSQVNVKKGKFTALDDSVGRSYAFEILIEELVGKSGNARMMLAAENQEEFDTWKDTFEVCFSTAEKKIVRRTSSIINPPVQPPTKPGDAPAEAPPAPAPAAAAASTAAPQPPTPPAAPGASAARIARPPPVKPAVPSRTGSATNMGAVAAAAAPTTEAPVKPSMPSRTGSASDMSGAATSVSTAAPAAAAVVAPVKPTMPTRTGSASNMTAAVPPTPPAMPGSAGRTLSPPPPARPKEAPVKPSMPTRTGSASDLSDAAATTTAAAPAAEAPAKPAMPRTGSASRMPAAAPPARPAMPGSATRSLSPPPPARPKPVEPAAEAPAAPAPVAVAPVVPPPVAEVAPVSVAEPQAAPAPAPAPRAVTPPPPPAAPVVAAAARAITPPPPAVPRSVSPPPPPSAAVTTPVKPVAAAAPAESTEHTSPIATVPASVPSPRKAEVTPESPVFTPSKVAPALPSIPEEKTPEEKTVTSAASSHTMGRTNSITISPFSSSSQAAQQIHQDSDEGSPIATPPPPPATTPRTASKLFQNVEDTKAETTPAKAAAPVVAAAPAAPVTPALPRGASTVDMVPEAFRGSPDSVGSDYSDEVSVFDEHTSPMAPGRLPSSGNLLVKSVTIAAIPSSSEATPVSVLGDEISISGPNSFTSPGAVRKTESQSVPPLEQNSPVPTSPFASQPNTPNTALMKIAAAQNKFKAPKFKNLLNSNGIPSPEKENEKVTPPSSASTSASASSAALAPPSTKKLSAADLNRLREEEEALLPPIIHKKIRTTRRRRELTITVRPTENVRMGYLAKLDSASKHMDEEAWMSQFVSFNIQTGIFTHFAEINGRRIPRGKYDVNAIDVYTIEQVYHGKLFTFKLTRSVTDETTGLPTDELLAAFAAEDLQQLNYWLISFEDCVTEAEKQAEVKRINSERALAKKNSRSELTVDVAAPVEKAPEMVSPPKVETPSMKPKNSVRDTIKTLARAPSFHFPKAESPVPSPPHDQEPAPEPVKMPTAIEAALMAKKSVLKRPSLSSNSRDSGDEISPGRPGLSTVNTVGSPPSSAAAGAPTTPRELPPLPPRASVANNNNTTPSQEPLTALLQKQNSGNRSEVHFNSAPATPLGTADHKQYVDDLPNTFMHALNKTSSNSHSMFQEHANVVDLDDLDRSLGLDNMSSIVSPLAPSNTNSRPVSLTRVPSMKLAQGSSVAALQLATSQASQAAANAANAAAAANNANNTVSFIPSSAAPASSVSHPKVLHNDVLGMKFKVDQVKYPAARLARRIKIWYCSSGFSLSSEVEVRQFVIELKNTGDETLKSFADEKFDNILDWANLLEVLRKYELKLRLESPQSEIEDQSVVCKVGVTVPSRGDRVTYLDLHEDVTVAGFAEKLAKEFNVPLDDLLVHLPVLFTRSANPHQQSLNLFKDDLTFAEDLILYQEEVIDHLWDSYSVIKNLVEQRDDVINQLYTQISELKESNKLTFRDTIFNGGLSNNDSPNGSSHIQRLQYSETPRKAARDSVEEDTDVVISKEEWRLWTEEKHKLILQHNEAKASLVNEIRLLRKTLNPSTEQTYLEMKRSEASRAMLEEELVKAQIQNDALKTEVAVMKQRMYESDIEKGMMESDWMERLNTLAAKYEERLLQQYTEHQQELAQRSYFASEGSYLQPELQNDLTNNNYYLPSNATVIDHDAVHGGAGGYSFNMALGAERLDPEYSQFQQQQQMLNSISGFNGNSSGKSFTDPEAHTLESLLHSNSFNASNAANRTPPSTASPNSRSNSITSNQQMQMQQQDKSQWIQQYAQNHHALLGSSPPNQFDENQPSRYRSYSQQQQQGLMAPPELDQDLMDLSMYRSEYFADGHDSQPTQVSPSRRSSADAGAGGAGVPANNVRPRSTSNDLRSSGVDSLKNLPQSSSVANANNRLNRATGNTVTPGSQVSRREPQTFDLSQGLDSYNTTSVNRAVVNSEHPLRQALKNDTLNRLGGNNKAMPKPTRPQFPFQPRNDAAKRLQQEQQRQQEALRSQPGILPAPIGRAISPNRSRVPPQSPSRFMTNTENYKNKFNSEKEFVNPHIVDRHSGGWKFS